jgi:hypothetical protein
VFSATDSRGNTNALILTPDFVDYVPISCVLGNSIPDASGKMTVKAYGNCFVGSFGKTSNSVKAGDVTRYEIDPIVSKDGVTTIYLYVSIGANE